MENQPRVFTNPILPGFAPDPSLCKVGDDFYLATSSFAYYPGIPIHHSRDLVHWELVGNALDRPSQLPLAGKKHSHGIFAPCIRFHEGLFYLTCTVVPEPGNFVITAKDPAGPWSEPQWLRDAPGIDPSLFFDDDGRAWYVGTRPAPEGEAYFGNWEVWLREFDLKALTLTGESRGLWRGALRDAVWPEGPRLYKKDGSYYLLIAEGGTAHHHAVTVAHADRVTGPYAGNPGNPILTHRHFGLDFPIVNVGHADLVEASPGEWWMSLLASRPYGGRFSNLGRETFLCPVSWEEGWPVASPGRGRLESSYPAPGLPERAFPPRPERDDFDGEALDPEWVFLRTPPLEPFHSLAERKGHLRLKLRSPSMTGQENPSCALIRQRDMSFDAATAVEFRPAAPGEAAGLVIMQNEDWQFRFEVVMAGEGVAVRAVAREGGVERVIGERAVGGAGSGQLRIELRLEARGQSLSFFCGPEGSARDPVALGADGTILSAERAGGFVGACLGLFATSNGAPSSNVADFGWFEYRGLDSGERGGAE